VATEEATAEDEAGEVHLAREVVELFVVLSLRVHRVAQTRNVLSITHLEHQTRVVLSKHLNQALDNLKIN
jgi:hypothetical protein